MTESVPVTAPLPLPELAAVWWRPRVTERRLRGIDRMWTLVALAHSLPFLAAAIALSLLKPVTIPIGVALLAHGWAIPELYAARGAAVLGPVRRRDQAPTQSRAEAVAMGLLGDLVSHRARDIRARTGLVMEPGNLGVWLLGESGALLVRPGGRRVQCYCVKVADPDLPPSDRTAHLLLALREDEAGFATVANLAFAGAVWRLRRRVNPKVREALAAAVLQDRATRSSRP
ncbi:MAG: hypothetical protein JO244_03575 [Solirubrobacterales bacterium]|nr:hypothetical protein [Solirubrobacterales bacterium]